VPVVSMLSRVCIGLQRSGVVAFSAAPTARRSLPPLSRATLPLAKTSTARDQSTAAASFGASWCVDPTESDYPKKAEASILEHGFVMLPEIFSTDELGKLRGTTVGRLEEVLSILSSRGIRLDVGSKAGFREVCLRSPLRWDVPCSSDALPGGVIDGIRRVTRRVLAKDGGEDVIEAMGVVRAEPGCPAQGWHADSAHTAEQHGPPNMLNVLITLSDVAEESGPTEVVPGSQRLTNHMRPGARFTKDIVYQNDENSPELIGSTAEGVKALMPAGSALIFDDRVLHRGGANASNSNRDVAFFSFRRQNFATTEYYEATRSLQGYDHRAIAQSVRLEFPGLRAHRSGRGGAIVGMATLEPVFADGAGGSQIHESVITAMVDQMQFGVANIGGHYATSERVGDAVVRARGAMADFMNCAPHEVVFGPTMTALAYHVSRALGNSGVINPGDNVVLDPISHGANIWTWVQLAERCGAEVRWLPVAPSRCESGKPECLLDARPDRLAGVIDTRTRLVAAGGASNGVGSVHDVRGICAKAKELSRGSAFTFVDMVHFAPHALIDTVAIGCDFLACSPYKFFGPHAGVLFGREELLRNLRVDRLDCQDDRLPCEATGHMSRFEVGTQSFETLAGIAAAVDYLAGVGSRFGGAAADLTRRQRLEAAWQAIGAHERELKVRFLTGAAELVDVDVLGVRDIERAEERMPTFAVSKRGIFAEDLARALCERGVWCTAGTHYARLWDEHSGGLATNDRGMARISFLHYNTLDEVDRVLDVLKRV